MTKVHNAQPTATDGHQRPSRLPRQRARSLPATSQSMRRAPGGAGTGRPISTTTHLSGTSRAMDAAVHLTPGQTRVLEAFRRRAHQGRPPPTYRDLCAEFGWSSTGTARDHIKARVQKGVLRPAAGRARGACLREPSGMESVTLPVVGGIVAGHPVPAEEHVERRVPVPHFLAPREGAFLLRVRGDSMQGASILDGDLVVVVPNPDPTPGFVVAVTIAGETTLKRLESVDQRFRLVAENPAYEPIEVDTEDVVVHGVVTGLLRTLGRGKGMRPVPVPAAVQRHTTGRQA